MKKKNEHKYSTEGLRRTMFIYFTIALFISVSSLAFLISATLMNHLKQAENKDIVYHADTTAMAISEWSRRAKDLARQITSRTRIRQELVKYNEGKISLNQLKKFTEPKLRDAMNLSDEIKAIIRLGRNRKTVAICGRPELTSVIKDKTDPYLSDKTLISSPFMLKEHLYVVVTAPIIHKGSGFQGTDLVIIDTCFLNDIIKSRTESDENRLIFAGFMDRETGVNIFSGTNGNTDIPPGLAFSLERAIKNEKGFESYNGIAMAFTPIDDSEWGLAVTQNTNELYAPLYEKLWYIAIISLVVFAVVLAGFVLIMKPLAGRMLLHSGELEEEIKKKTVILENEIAERIKTQEEKEKVITELKKAMEEIKTLNGLLPICSYCKKIRDDTGYWNQLEVYIKQHSDADFSHSICPDCAREHFPEIYDKIKDKG